ncbi:AAA family ATPase [Hansschlegelia beijingensis]
MITGVLLMIDRVRAERPSVILIGATNHIGRLDEALKRPGRFDRHVEIRPPETVEDLSQILRHHLGGDLRGQDIARAAKLGLGATGADAELWVKQARQRARAASRPMTLADLIDVIAPPDATPLELRRAIALHEAAHAVVGLALGRRLLSVSIVSRGSTGGVTTFATDQRVLTRDDLERHVKTTLAGRAVDILFSGAATTGAASDLRQATTLVTAIHASFGLADTLLSRVPPERADEVLALDPELRRIVSEDLDRLMRETVELVAAREAEIRALAEMLLEQRCVTERQ